MSKSRANWRAKQKAKYKQEQLENKLSTQNKYGFADLTPYNAIAGKDMISKATLTNCKQRANGSFNG